MSCGGNRLSVCGLLATWETVLPNKISDWDFDSLMYLDSWLRLPNLLGFL